MTFTWTRIVVCCGLLAFTCCQGETRDEIAAPVRGPGLRKLTIGPAVVYVDVARTDAARRQGLMYRKSLPEDEGMLFVYGGLETRSFYMRNTYVPLSLAFIDEQGRIFQFVDMEPLDETSHLSVKPMQYALEVNQGWFAKHGIKIGDRIENLPSTEGAGW